MFTATRTTLPNRSTIDAARLPPKRDYGRYFTPTPISANWEKYEVLSPV